MKSSPCWMPPSASKRRKHHEPRHCHRCQLRHRPGAEGKGHPLHGHESRLGEARAFQANDGSEVQYFGRLYEAKDCVATGLMALYRSKKDDSVHGLPVKLQVPAVKPVPHRFVMNIWLNQQKKPKNNQGLTTK